MSNEITIHYYCKLFTVIFSMLTDILCTDGIGYLLQHYITAHLLYIYTVVLKMAKIR